jgi:hypothetical protein
LTGLFAIHIVSNWAVLKTKIMLLVKFEKTIQVNEDEWRNVWVEKVFNEFTTLNEIVEWAKSKQNKDKVENYKLDLRGLIITELEE